MGKKRVYEIDALKFFAAFLVICLHVGNPNSIYTNHYIRAVCQVAVPLFFLISGYFFASKTNVKISVINLIKCFALAYAVYFVIGFLQFCLFDNHALSEYFAERVSVKNIILFFAFNEVSNTIYSGRHLWYLLAIIYVLFIEKYLINKTYILSVSTVVVIVINLMFGSYSVLLFKREFPPCLTRNFLLIGIPMFNLGRIIREKSNYIKKISPVILPVILCCLFVETFAVKVVIQDQSGDLLISTVVFAVYSFLLFCNIKGGKVFEKLGELGKKYGLYIYIVHPALIIGLNAIFKESVILAYIEPMVVLILSLIVSYIYSIIKKRCVRL